MYSGKISGGYRHDVFQSLRFGPKSHICGPLKEPLAFLAHGLKPSSQAWFSSMFQELLEASFPVMMGQWHVLHQIYPSHPQGCGLPLGPQRGPSVQERGLEQCERVCSRLTSILLFCACVLVWTHERSHLYWLGCYFTLQIFRVRSFQEESCSQACRLGVGAQPWQTVTPLHVSLQTSPFAPCRWPLAFCSRASCISICSQARPPHM